MPKEEKVEEQIIEEAVEETTETAEIAEPTETEATEPAEIINEAQDLRQEEIADNEESVTIQPVRFASFEHLDQVQGETNKNLDILMDIKLQLTVELGRTELSIKKVLELTRGSIIELEKIAGEPVELYANGKLVAHGEVVVIEDNFGLRITSITDPDERLKGV